MKKFTAVVLSIAITTFSTVTLAAAPRERERDRTPIARIAKLIKQIGGIVTHGDWPQPPLPKP